jgi:hypothetical protein
MRAFFCVIPSIARDLPPPTGMIKKPQHTTKAKNNLGQHGFNKGLLIQNCFTDIS